MYIMCNFNELEKNINNLVPMIEFFDTNVMKKTRMNFYIIVLILKLCQCGNIHDLYDPYCDRLFE